MAKHRAAKVRARLTYGVDPSVPDSDRTNPDPRCHPDYRPQQGNTVVYESIAEHSLLRW